LKKLLTTLLLSTFIYYSGCDNNSPDSYQISFHHWVAGEPLVLDSMIYQNAAGQNYSIKSLKYLIRGFHLLEYDGPDDVNIHLMDNEKHFVTTDDPNTFILDFPPSSYGYSSGNHEKFAFTFGVDSSWIPPSNDDATWGNDNFHTTMFWPESIGGGYHYMKLEGAFDNDSTFYYIHTGGTDGKVFTFTKAFDVDIRDNNDGSHHHIAINMDINNWFNNPNTISFTTDGIMENESIQQKLKENGEADVFSVR